MTFYEKDGFTLVRRHGIIMFFNYLQFFFFLGVGFFLYFISVKFQTVLGYDLVKFVFFPIIFLIINFAFFKFIFEIIRYFNNLIILEKDHLIVIKTSLIDTDNVEIIDLDKITKIDTSIKGVFSNLLSYGDLILEQNRARTRTFNHIYKPYLIATYIKEAKKKNKENTDL